MVVAYHSIGVRETTKISCCLVDVQLKRIVSSLSAVLSHIVNLLITNRETNKHLEEEIVQGLLQGGQGVLSSPLGIDSPPLPLMNWLSLHLILWGCPSSPNFGTTHLPPLERNPEINTVL